MNSLYDHIITFRHRELRDAWGSIYKAEEALAKSKNSNVTQGKTLLAEAKKLASQVPISDKRAADKEITGLNQSRASRPSSRRNGRPSPE